ncbi:MAG: M23 family metallopeptidase [Mangrovibacterium sp.]
MKYILLSFVTLLCMSAHGRPGDLPDRKREIEKCMGKIYSVHEFRQIAGSWRMSVNELSRYPVISPVKYPYISSGFGKRKHPVYKAQQFHTGIDFAQVRGAPVYAAGNGVVVRNGYDSGYGIFIEIQYVGGFRSFYAHLSKTIVNAGDSVWMGKRIARVENSGTSIGYHLHYEIRKGNRFLNPTEWCCCLLDVLKSKHNII